MSDHHFTTVGSGPHEGAIEDCVRCKSREEYKNRTEFLLGREVFEFDQYAERLVLAHLDHDMNEWWIEDTAMMTFCLVAQVFGDKGQVVTVLASPMVEVNNGNDPHDYLWSASVELDGQEGQGEYPRGPEPNTATPQEVAKWLEEVVIPIADKMKDK